MHASELVASEYAQIARAVKAIGTGNLATGGKLNPAQNAPKRRRRKAKVRIADPYKGESKEEPADTVKDISCTFLEVAKADKQIVTGVVLQPEVVDAQGDIMSADVIAEAAFGFLAKFNKTTKLGLQHTSFKVKENRFQLIESFIAPLDFVLGTTPIKKGTWLMSVKFLDSKIWKDVKDGKITGFSIGGKARAVAVPKQQPGLSLAA